MSVLSRMVLGLSVHLPWALLQREDFEKAYPPFVNFFEKTKETLMQCDAERPRFHAFLKVSWLGSRPPRRYRAPTRIPAFLPVAGDCQCGRGEIQKRTPKENRDSQNLDHAIAALNQVML
ncbi:hypothetical protein IscW_ISCW008205 [Ixodes scapularis]|uniref:Uncharacterized protein n=1 Tax=Ixodes scapularis TaxID=6945 RepID=B7PTV5_IXOSC|nr:hypothetical protein IscW_ISCW008205 [Ixodes scapularis]|eukprot:XP_002404976.1 hypothetical protein IscW_ISCW008205 [Ixodes scapularis]